MVSSARQGVQSWLDGRFVPVRAVALVCSAVGYLLFLAAAPSALDWLLALVAVSVAAGGVRWPFVSSLAVSGMLLLGFVLGDTGPVVAKVAAAIVLIELAARRSGPQPWLAAAALAAAYLLHPSGDLAANGYRAVVMAGAPLLVGALLRAARETAEHAHAQAVEIAQRRDAEIAAARALERTAIARELHDLIAHHVSSTVLRVGVALHAMPEAPAGVRDVLDSVHTSGKETLTDLRRLVSVLRDPALTEDPFIAPADLPAALDAVVARARQSGIEVGIAVADEVVEVDAVLALTVLRLTQEGVANVIKHAGPGTAAQLTVDLTADDLCFVLCDKGSPRPTGERVAAPGTGLGLIGLRERVELLGGEFTAAASAAGWRLSACLPIGKPVRP
ncbi:sensor histidine kinase [Nocardia brasiliensis]|nr:histidine kinase [Nocardia brasiliensis]